MGVLPTLDCLKGELRARLEHVDHGGIPGRDGWVRDAGALPLYESEEVARFLLLAAHHDSGVASAHNSHLVREIVS